jgi:multidrug efflux pump subunit AcrA (membrane-fusion protein)
MATVLNPIYTEPIAPPVSVPTPPIPMKQRPRRTWIKWGLLAGIAIALAVGVELWRMHAANAIGYDTVAVDRGPIQASVTATGTLNAVVDVQVGSQV